MHRTGRRDRRRGGKWSPVQSSPRIPDEVDEVDTVLGAGKIPCPSGGGLAPPIAPPRRVGKGAKGRRGPPVPCAVPWAQLARGHGRSIRDPGGGSRRER